MNGKLRQRSHNRGRGRIFVGLVISTIGYFWFAKKVGWVGIGGSGLAWPILVIAIGITLVVTGAQIHNATRNVHSTESERVAK